MAPTPEANIRFNLMLLTKIQLSPINFESTLSIIHETCAEIENVTAPRFTPINDFVKYLGHFYETFKLDAELEYIELIKKFPALANWPLPQTGPINLFDRAFKISQVQSQELRKIILDRNIHRLVHFTDIRNIPSITTHGLLSNRLLTEKNIPTISFDDFRLDNMTDGVCTSISEPNIAILTKRYSWRNYKDLAVIEFEPTLLLEIPFLAFPTNAASREFSRIRYENPSSLMGSMGLGNLFANGIQRRNYGTNEIRRERLNIPNCEPTDPQAEVIFEAQIPVSAFKRVHVSSKIREFQQETREMLLSQIQASKWHVECEWSKCFRSFDSQDWQQRNLDPNSISGIL